MGNFGTFSYYKKELQIFKSILENIKTASEPIGNTHETTFEFKANLKKLKIYFLVNEHITFFLKFFSFDIIQNILRAQTFRLTRTIKNNIFTHFCFDVKRMYTIKIIHFYNINCT